MQTQNLIPYDKEPVKVSNNLKVDILSAYAPKLNRSEKKSWNQILRLLSKIHWCCYRLSWCFTQRVPKSLLNLQTRSLMNSACCFIISHFTLALQEKNISFRSFWISSLKFDVLIKASLKSDSHLPKKFFCLLQ